MNRRPELFFSFLNFPDILQIARPLFVKASETWQNNRREKTLKMKKIASCRKRKFEIHLCPFCAGFSCRNEFSQMQVAKVVGHFPSCRKHLPWNVAFSRLITRGKLRAKAQRQNRATPNLGAFIMHEELEFKRVSFIFFSTEVKAEVVTQGKRLGHMRRKTEAPEEARRKEEGKRRQEERRNVGHVFGGLCTS